MIQPLVEELPISRTMKAMTEPAAVTTKTWDMIAKHEMKTTVHDFQVSLIGTEASTCSIWYCEAFWSA